MTPKNTLSSLLDKDLAGMRLVKCWLGDIATLQSLGLLNFTRQRGKSAELIVCLHREGLETVLKRLCAGQFSYEIESRYGLYRRATQEIWLNLTDMSATPARCVSGVQLETLAAAEQLTLISRIHITAGKKFGHRARSIQLFP